MKQAIAGLTLLGAAWLTGCDEKADAPTAPDPHKISVSSPSEGAKFRLGDTLTVDWSSTEFLYGVDIRLSTDGKNWPYFLNTFGIVPGDADWGHFKWVVRDTLSVGSMATHLAGKDVSIRVELGYGTSDTTFISAARNITILP